MKAISNKILLLGIVFFSFSTQLLAQPGFDDDTVDVPAAPIDEWVYPMFIIGILSVFWVVRIKQNTIKQNR